MSDSNIIDFPKNENRKIVCSECGSTNVGQLYIVDPNETDDDSLFITEIWDAFVCFDCEDDCEADVVYIN
jgi:hypothetical protein